ncbi:TPA: hypothetical protein ACHJ0Y_005498, partial [Escherichia coli]
TVNVLSGSENINSFNFCMSLDEPVIQPSKQNRGPKDGPKAFKQLCVKNPSRLYVSVFADGTKRIPLGFLLVAPGPLTFQLHTP